MKCLLPVTIIPCWKGYPGIRSCLAGLLMLIFLSLSAQQDDRAIFSMPRMTASLSDALVELSERSGVNIFFSNELVKGLDANLEAGTYSFEEALLSLLYGRQIKYKKINGYFVLYKSVLPVQKFTISGYLEDATSGERLEYATIHDYVTAVGTETNSYGFYSLSLPAGDVDLTYRYLGYEQQIVRLSLVRDTQINMALLPSNLIPEVIVKAREVINPIEDFRFGQKQVQVRDLARLPALGGELDLYRYVEMEPGIQTGTDGVGGVHVRGGSNDQNLILMDGVPIYNPAHLLGIFSVFNPDMIRQAEIHKANFPARYGGRLSSVMDIKTREGNTQQFSGRVKVGLASANAVVEGPLFSGKSSFIVAGRWFLPSLFFRDISARYKKTIEYEGDTYLNFHDLNVKWNWQVGPRDRIYLSYYQGRDLYEDFTISNTNQTSEILIDGEPTSVGIRTEQQFEKNINWGNRIAAIRWNHQFSDKIFLNHNLFFSRYVLQSFEKNSFEQRIGEPLDEMREGFDVQEFTSSIEDIGYRLQIDMIPSLAHFIRVGGYVTSHTFLPKSITFNEESKIDDFYIEEGLLENTLFSEFEIDATEWGLFIEDDWKIVPDHLLLNAGMHLGGFWVKGKSYVYPQFRALLNYMPSSVFSVQAGISQMTQFLHLLTNSGIGLPTDLWVPATDQVEPQSSLQASIGFRYRPVKQLSFELEAYTKNLRRLIAFQEGASFLVPAGPLATSILDAANWEDKITTGSGISRGIEAMATFQGRKLFARAAYAFSDAERTFPEINFGESFPYRYNRRHSLSLQASVQLGRKLSLKTNWVYGTGNHITLAESKFSHPGDIFPEVGITFGSRNGYLLPSYHRLDLGAELQLGSGNKIWNHAIYLDIYNVYNRENPFYISLVENAVEGTFSFKQFSVFRILPSIGYAIRFR